MLSGSIQREQSSVPIVKEPSQQETVNNQQKVVSSNTPFDTTVNEKQQLSKGIVSSCGEQQPVRFSPTTRFQHSRDWLTETVTVVFSCSCPFYVGDDAVLAVCGSTQALGGWNIPFAIWLEREPYSEGLWRTKLKLPHTQVEYKYLILSKQDNNLIRWENRLNRNLDLVESKMAAKVVQDTFDR